MTNCRLLSLSLSFLLAPAAVAALERPPGVKHLPQAYYDRLRANPDAFQFKNGFLRLTAKARAGRDLYKQGQAPLGIVSAVKGHKAILVLLAQFSDTATVPYRQEALSNALFGRSGGTPLPGTLSAYYAENSYGNLALDGAVQPWRTLAHGATYYAGKPTAGGDPCYGICENSRVPELVEEVARLSDSASLWGAYDNDGPDDQSNTADDDGKVDFLVVVHPGMGAECDGAPAGSLWSHHALLSNWSGHTAFATKTKSNSTMRSGGRLQIDDYVLVPAVACDGVTPIQIGVIAHEFGHALGLPDLYDTSKSPASEGLGNWDLMAGGSWGGDGESPERPVHMSAWSKAFLGWVHPAPHPEGWAAIPGQPQHVLGDLAATKLAPYETSGDVYLVTIRNEDAASQANVYYLISNRQRIGFDAKVPGTGLLILRVDEEKLKASLKSNEVNNDPAQLGVAVVEADGRSRLIHHRPDPVFRGGSGDTFPGDARQTTFDNGSKPGTAGSIAVCDIAEADQSVKLTLWVSRGLCDSAASPAASPSNR